MSRETNTTPPGPGAFVRRLTVDDDAIGGKARSLARLAELGLPVPRGFAVGAALFRRLRADGPPLPKQLRSAADLACLDAARAALETAPFPEGFEQELGIALGALNVLDAVQSLAAATLTFAVRSSVGGEDRAGTLGAGIYASILRVPRTEVADAIRRVLASCLTPAAWVYAAARWSTDRPSDDARMPDASVLIHPFVDGDAAGVAALAPTNATNPDGVGARARNDVRVDVHFGEVATVTRGHIDSAVRHAAARCGPVEIEWVARGDTLTFLQLRAYQPVPKTIGRMTDVSDVGAPPPSAASHGPPSHAAPDDGWTWDAAHNPLPLSPAQADLVRLVDETCSVGFRQKVVGGYLFHRRSRDPHPVPAGQSPREAFDHLTANIEPRLAALGREPSLAAALEVFVAAYQPLFGVVGPACVAAREALGCFLTERLPNRAASLSALLRGIPSAASRRRAAALAISDATGVRAQQMAIDNYLEHFGDESPRWDVAEPTLGETPDVLLRLIAPKAGQPRDVVAPFAPANLEATDDHGLPLGPLERGRFDQLLRTARESAAVAEDDDALYARLQAGVRRALLGVGRRLHAAGRLRAIDDIFFLPLGLVRAIDDPRGPCADHPQSTSAGDLNAVARAGREAFRIALSNPPSLSKIHSPITEIVRGVGGASGRAIGRAIHHPTSLPTGPHTVLIASTLLPTELPLLAPGAIVVETGSILGHVAAQARERGIPAVVAATGARAAIRPGALVLVDGDRGEVMCLGEG